MSENTTDQSSQERRVGPTVSRDKWYLHARQKLSKGYKLIVARDGKKRANFWTAEKGFEMCAFEVARALVLSGEVAHTGEHPLGNVYELIQTDAPAPKAKPSKAKPKPVKVVPPVEDEPDLLDPIATDDEETEDDVADDPDLDDVAEEAEEDEDDLTDLDDDEDVKL